MLGSHGVQSGVSPAGPEEGAGQPIGQDKGFTLIGPGSSICSFLPQRLPLQGDSCKSVRRECGCWGSQRH